MKRKLLNRRTLLRHIVSTGASLPFLTALPSLGAPDTPRKRFILMFSPNGTIPSAFFPSGGEQDFTFNEILRPLEPIRSEINVYKGLDNKIGSPGDGHQRGMGGLWTSSHLTEGDTVGGNSNEVGVDWAGGISIDQAVANHIGNDTRYRSLEYGVRVDRNNVWSRMCYRGSNQPVTPEESPYAAFDRLYGDAAGAGDASAEAQRAQRLGSVLDSLVQDFAAARPYLSAEDRLKLEQHSESVRSIERSLELPDDTSVCTLPTMGNVLNLNSDANIPALGKLFMDLMVSSFACDLTAVASLQWTRSVSNAQFPNLGINRNHHSISHHEDSRADTVRDLTAINKWYAEQFYYLANALKNTPDPSGGGSLLDNSFLVWGNELGKGNNHTRRDIPFVSAGSCQGYFRTGRYIQTGGRISHSRFLTSIANAYGLQVNGFGDYNEGPLENMR